MENRFNLVEEPWIPVADVGCVSLRQLFSNPAYRDLGGNPVQKIALMKLLLAIAQAANTPADERAWWKLGADGVAKECLSYLDRWREYFYLYGDKPFLQIPAIASAALQSYGAVSPEISTGNTTVLNHGQMQRALSDAEKAVLLVTLMAFALAGKKTDNSVVLSLDYSGKRNDKGKPSSSKAGPAVAHLGLLHNFVLGDGIWETLWLNLLDETQIVRSQMFPEGLGVAPWERMPEGEDCIVAQKLKQSLMGRLVPLCRFCLLTDAGLHYSEGLAHPGYKEGVADPSVAINHSGKEPKALWVDPEKRPWRELTSLLSFIDQSDGEGFQSFQIRVALSRVREATETFGIWSGGLRVSSNAGEQYASGGDDFVRSLVWFDACLLGKSWFAQFKSEMAALDELAKVLYGRVLAYFKEQKMDGGKVAVQAMHRFWQLCERDCQRLVDNCEQKEECAKQRRQLRLTFACYQQQIYDHCCPKGTSRQMDAWARWRPDNSEYLKGGSK